MNTIKAVVVAIGGIVASIVLGGAVLLLLSFGMAYAMWQFANIEIVKHSIRAVIEGDFLYYFNIAMIALIASFIVYNATIVVKRDFMDENGKLKWPK